MDVIVRGQGVRRGGGRVVSLRRGRGAQGRVLRRGLRGEKGWPAFVGHGDFEAFCDGGDVEDVASADHE
eukprot:2791071-Pleurochrysis_carterae.AAC.1